MLGAVMFGFDNFQPVINLIADLAKEAGKEKWEAPVFPPEFDELYNRLAKDFTKEYEEALVKVRTLKAQVLALNKELACAEDCLPYCCDHRGRYFCAYRCIVGGYAYVW